MNDTQHRPDERESDPEFLILVSLSESPKHVYAMINVLDHLAGVRLGQDTLYGAIARLAQRGLVEPLVTNDHLQPYNLTPVGAEIARSKFMRLADLANAWYFTGCKSLLRTRLQPGEQLQDIVRGSYEGSPIYSLTTTRDAPSPHDC
jgi:DNA-binding PadR family transcriptional regulator